MYGLGRTRWRWGDLLSATACANRFIRVYVKSNRPQRHCPNDAVRTYRVASYLIFLFGQPCVDCCCCCIRGFSLYLEHRKQRRPEFLRTWCVFLNLNWISLCSIYEWLPRECARSICIIRYVNIKLCVWGLDQRVKGSNMIIAPTCASHDDDDDDDDVATQYRIDARDWITSFSSKPNGVKRGRCRQKVKTGFWRGASWFIATEYGFSTLCLS